jgi:hypothetical protein
MIGTPLLNGHPFHFYRTKYLYLTLTDAKFVYVNRPRSFQQDFFVKLHIFHVKINLGFVSYEKTILASGKKHSLP